MNRAARALEGISVFDAAGAAAYCGNLFADRGADVAPAGPPGSGFAARGLAPFAPGAAPPESSAVHAYLSTNTRSVEWDLENPGDAAKFFEAAQDGAPFDIEHPAPTLGQRNREILGGILGLSGREIADLAEAGIIGDSLRMPVRRKTEGKRR